MKITYHPNPLRTMVELDESEAKELWYKTKIEEMHNVIFEAHFCLDKDHFNLESAREAVDTKQLYGDKDKKAYIDELTDEMHKHYLDALRDRHIGDCTCCASSCIKCHAENLLGIDTIKGLRKHAAHHVDAAFDGTNGTIESALECLKNYEPKASWKGWEAYADGWRRQAAQAYEWLLAYRNKHFL